MSETLKVHLAGREYQLRRGGDTQLVLDAARLVEERLANIPASLSADTRDRQMLALLDLAGEYLKEQRLRQTVETQLNCTQEQVETLEQLKQREAALAGRIESALRD